MSTDLNQAPSAPVLASVPKRKVAPPAKQDWLRFVGWAKDDAAYPEALRVGAEYRQSQTYEHELQRLNEDS